MRLRGLFLIETRCPSCGTEGAYVGLSDVECPATGCRHYKSTRSAGRGAYSEIDLTDAEIDAINGKINELRDYDGGEEINLKKLSDDLGRGRLSPTSQKYLVDKFEETNDTLDWGHDGRGNPTADHDVWDGILKKMIPDSEDPCDL